MNNFHYKSPECPEHHGEYLKATNLIVKSPYCPEGEGFPLEFYCPQSKRYIVSGKLVSKKEAGLNSVNKIHNTNYKLSEIEVMTIEEFSKT